MTSIGITERGDPSFDMSWIPWAAQGKPTILITKNPEKILDVLQTIHNRNVIVHCTITGYGATNLEPEVPPVSRSIPAYFELCDYLFPERVVLRVDPVIPTTEGVEVARNVLKLRRRRTTGRNARISFIDQYDHIKGPLHQCGIDLPWETFHAPVEIRRAAWDALEKPDVCGEPDFPCVGCVSEMDCKILGVKPFTGFNAQRKFCACLANKKELLKKKKQCPHLCMYCYFKP
jgi:hypothetical protein